MTLRKFVSAPLSKFNVYIRLTLSDSSRYTPTQIAKLVDGRDGLIGERDERTPEEVKFERFGFAPRKDPLNRVSGFGAMVQRQRHVDAPPASVKVYDGALDTDQTHHKAFLSVSNRLC